MIGLCSKTYYCFGEKNKFSCKGVNKKLNPIDKEKYLQVLRLSTMPSTPIIKCVMDFRISIRNAKC